MIGKNHLGIDLSQINFIGLKDHDLPDSNDRVVANTKVEFDEDVDQSMTKDLIAFKDSTVAHDEANNESYVP